MVMCDMCGREAIYRASVEGAELNVCESCARYGKVMEEIRVEKESKIRYVKKESKVVTEPVRIIVPNYPQLIREAREKMGLTQKEMANAVSEKESLIHSLEVGKYEPSIKIAQKLEKFLKIKLIKELDERGEVPTAKRGEGYTIGDFIKVKKR